MKGNLSCVSCCVLCFVLLVRIVISIFYLYHKTIRQFRWRVHGISVVLKKYKTRNNAFPSCHAVPVSTVLLSCFGAISYVAVHRNKTLYETEARRTA